MVLTIAVFSVLAATTVSLAGDVDSNVITEFLIDGYSGIPLVPVRHEGSQYVFVLDTGSANTSFGPELFGLLTKTPRGATIIEGDRSTRVNVYRSPELQLGAVTIPELSSITCIGAEFFKTIPGKIHGQFGVDAMRNLLIRIDFDRGKISLLRKLPSNAGVRLALNEKRWCGLPIVTGNIEGVEQSFVLDTGCFTYGAGRMVKRKFDEMIAQGKLIVVEVIQSWSGSDTQEHRMGVVVGPVSVAGYRHAGLVFGEIPNADWTVNVLGIGYLRRYITTFDFQQGAVYLSPSNQFRQLDASHDPGGIRLRRGEDGAVVVTNVAGPAMAAGVKVDDMLETIDGAATNSFDDAALARVLSVDDGPAALEFRRLGVGAGRFTYHSKAALRDAVDKWKRQQR